MATVPEQEEPQPTRTQRVKAAVSKPDYRVPACLAAASAAAALAPMPFDSLAVACLVLVAWEGRKR